MTLIEQHNQNNQSNAISFAQGKGRLPIFAVEYGQRFEPWVEGIKGINVE